MITEVDVSVIVPMYNSERYLKDCLDSLANQTLRNNVEFICVDDGSTDETLIIAESYAKNDNRFKVITGPNRGFGHSMNVGISAAHGKFITSLDSDDLFASNALKTMLTFAESNDLDFLKADRLYFSGNIADSKTEYNRIGYSDEQYGTVFNSSEDPGRWMLKSGLPGMYRKSFLEGNSIKLNETPGASFQDTGLTAQAVFHGKRVSLLEEPLYYVRRDNENSSTHDSAKVFCICDEHDFIRTKASECAENRIACLHAAAWLRLEGYEWNYSRLLQEDRPKFVERAHNDFQMLDHAGELDQQLFSPEQWRWLELLVNNPMEYYALKQYEREIDRLESKAKSLDGIIKQRDSKISQLEALLKKKEDRVTALEKSKSYRIGRVITFAPRKARKALKGVLGKSRD